MIRSMTGYGEAERATPAGTLQVEVRTVNHRHFNANLRVPSSLSRWEAEIREWLRGAFARGHVNCSVRLEPPAGVPRGLRIDEDRAGAYVTLLRDYAARSGLPGEVDVRTLARFPDIFLRHEGAGEEAVEVPPEELRAAVDEAARRAVAMREDEGRRLHADLEGRLAAIEAALAEIERLAPGRLLAERDRLREAVRELAGGMAVSEDRLAQEIAYLAERWDVNEELVRFRSHLELFRELLAADASEAVGKRLGFLVQEMHREANTTGSKANHAAIAHRVVAVKEEVERLREQVENVE
ncbi:MAG TPA: YicC/YloC family endoribonuclease [Longimicrobiaceae bacterium]|nr:YicC/YloC family endoribonuclease [Longimicrobiaceae bacterium]